MSKSKGVNIRFTVHNILYNIYKYNKNLDSNSIKNLIKNYNEIDIAFITNVCLNSMRLFFHSNKIINLHTKKIKNKHTQILLISAITQIVFLNFKDYAVINCSVEIAKKLNIYHGFVNSCLKTISKNKNNLINTKIKFDDLPSWFQLEAKELNSKEKIDFLENFCKEPDVHIVFDSKQNLNKQKNDIYKTSDTTGFLKNKIKIEKLFNYRKGNWWVQDFSSSFPLNNLPEKKLDYKNIDLCAAPGGKSFQVISKHKKIVLNDISKIRINRLKENLKRLNMDAIILNKDILQFDSSNKYDFIILDAPCSSVGTIRRNPEIFFKSQEPNFSKILKLQTKMLDKASLLLNKNGLILYMVCSFLKRESFDQVESFIKKNKDFSLNNFYIKKNEFRYEGLVRNKVMYTLPTKINNFRVDGYFAAYLKKNK